MISSTLLVKETVLWYIYYSNLTNILSNTLEKDAPLMKKSRLRNRYPKYPSRGNLLAYKNIKNKCNNLLKQSQKKYIKDISSKGAATNKSF